MVYFVYNSFLSSMKTIWWVWGLVFCFLFFTHLYFIKHDTRPLCNHCHFLLAILYVLLECLIFLPLRRSHNLLLYPVVLQSYSWLLSCSISKKVTSSILCTSNNTNFVVSFFQQFFNHWTIVFGSNFAFFLLIESSLKINIFPLSDTNDNFWQFVLGWLPRNNYFAVPGIQIFIFLIR